MAITPQAIKDQEFQSKFRGYDTIEVKAYLDLVAEEFFELLEKVRQQEDEIAELTQEKGLLEELKENLEADIEAALRTTEDVRRESAAKDEKQAELAKEIEELQTAQADLEQEKQEFEEEVSAAEDRVAGIAEELQKSRNQQDSLLHKIELLEEQNRELKNEEIDFKRTIGAAQRFADSLKETALAESDTLRRESEDQAQELLRKSEEKAALALQAARDEIERLRREAYAELSRLPDEINRLNEQRKQVREDLRATLTNHLDQLDGFSGGDEAVKHYEYDELFQKIDIPETPVVEQNDLGDLDELDDISMELPLPDDTDFGEDQDELRNKLAEGGVAYLSDN